MDDYTKSTSYFYTVRCPQPTQNASNGTNSLIPKHPRFISSVCIHNNREHVQVKMGEAWE